LISHRVENPKNRIVCLVLRKTEQSYEEYLTPKRGTKCGVQFLSILLHIVAWLYEGGFIDKVRCTRQDVVKIGLSRAPLNSNPFLIKTKYTAVSTKHHKPSLFLVYMLMGMEHGT
jgi:hypothetical protein